MTGPPRASSITDIAMKAVDSLSTTNSSQYRPRAFPSSQWGQFTAMYGWDKATQGSNSTIFTARLCNRSARWSKPCLITRTTRISA